MQNVIFRRFSSFRDTKRRNPCWLNDSSLKKKILPPRFIDVHPMESRCLYFSAFCIYLTLLLSIFHPLSFSFFFCLQRFPLFRFHFSCISINRLGKYSPSPQGQGVISKVKKIDVKTFFWSQVKSRRSWKAYCPVQVQDTGQLWQQLLHVLTASRRRTLLRPGKVPRNTAGEERFSVRTTSHGNDIWYKTPFKWS